MRLPRTTRPLTRSRSVAGLTALALVAAGCAGEDAQQEAAREEVQAHVRALDVPSGYDPDEVQCTDAHGIWFRDEETNEFTCAVRRVEGGCDWFEVRVDRDRQQVRVRLAQRDAGCTLGFGD
jgi:hypothetical protein